MPERRLPFGRAALLVPAGVALLVGMDAALVLLGLPAPVRWERLPDVHGVLLVLGFVGTLVSLERAVALGRAWGFAAPACLGGGGLLLLSPLPRTAGAVSLVAGSAVLMAVYVPLWRRQPAVAVLAQAGGAVLATSGALLWLGGVPVPWLLPWLAGFVVLTIVGERMELARVAVLHRAAEPIATVLTAGVVLGAVAALLWPSVGYAVLGLAVVGLCAWLLLLDVARHTIRSTGLPRYMAVCLLAGYAWLAAAGGTWLVAGPVTDGRGYDAVVHCVFLGFVVSMLMAHAPVILPAVLRRPLPYHRLMFALVALLHVSLALRVVVGDVRGVQPALQVGGALNIVAVLLFAGAAAWSAATAGADTPVQQAQRARVGAA